MLNFLDHFSVPGVEHVMVYHDDQNPSLFHIVPELPSILRRDNGDPSFNLISFARDFTLLADAASALPTAETEGGLLQLTTSLEVSEDDQDAIRRFIQGGAGRRLRPVLEGRRLMLRRFARPRKVTLSYPTWVDGRVAFHLFPDGGDTFVKALQGSEKPSLVSSNLASYTALLGQEGVRLIRNSIEDGWSPGTVNYDVSFVARIPNLSVTVKGDASQVYEEIKQHSTITETYRNGQGTRTYRYPQVSSLEEMQDLFTGLHITYDKGDFRTGGGDGGEDPTAAIEDLVFSIVQQMITNKFLAPGFEPGLKAEKLGTDPLAHSGGEKMPGGNQLWLKDFRQEMNTEIDFSFSGSTNFTVEKHPNSELFAMVEPERVKASIIEADLSTPYFSLLDVPVQVTADFDRDPIAAIKVFCDYDQHDEQSGARKRQTAEFLFDSNDDRYYFRTVMARHADGTPKDEYTYRSQIIYKASAKSQDLAPVTTRDRNLIIGYDQLNCVNVQVYWGAISADAVSQAQVSFRYPGIDLPSANADVVLRLDAPQASWFTYTGDQTSREYEYTVTFFMSDGQLIELPTERSSTERLIINAPFQDKLAATFVPQGAFPPVASIVVTTEYVDGDYDVSDVHSFTGPGETWQWEIDLRDRSTRDFRYRVDVTYADGSSESGDWQPGREGTILVGEVAREMIEVDVVADLLDMTKWKLVLVRLAYDDPVNSVSLDHTIKLTAVPPTPDELRWTIPIKDPTKRSFTYQIQAFAHDGTKHVVGPTPTDDPLLLLEF